MVMWKDLEPDQRLLAVLNQADRERGSRSTLIATGASHDKNAWSNTFADGCARMVAAEFRMRLAGRLTVLPDAGGNAEPPTITYFERGQPKSKKIDVLVGDLVAGLQIAVSLKGVGFRDQTSLGFGKNITGRLYELESETRRLHEYRPQAVVVGLYFVPIGAVEDKRTARTPSGFADIVANVRSITGRIEPQRQDEWHRVDLGFVGLYVPGDPERFVTRDRDPSKRRPFSYDDPFERGVVRFFDVTADPPRRGRPPIATTLSLDEVVERVLEQTAPGKAQIDWATPESDE